MFGSTYSATELGTLARMVRHGHGAGLTLVKVFEMQAKSGPSALRDACGRIAERLKAGESLEDSLSGEGKFPEMFLAMSSVAERTGRIPEVFRQLSDYYQLQESLRRQFRAAAIKPIIVFCAGVLVTFLTIWILGSLPDPRGQTSMVSGPVAAFGFLFTVLAVLGGMFAFYVIMTKTVSQKAIFEAMLLRMPSIGPCVESIAMGRFCLAMNVTLDSSMSLHKGLRLALRASGNNAYIAQSEEIVRRVGKGEELSEAIGMNPVFPRYFVEFLSVGEESGQIPETMSRLAKHYEEETAIRMKSLTTQLSWAIYAMVSLFIIVNIFRFFANYANALNG
jgi:type II secretory pathway component PulF